MIFHGRVHQVLLTLASFDALGSLVLAIPPLPASSILIASDAAPYDLAATAVALWDSTAAFGVRGRDDGMQNRGAVYVNRLQGNVWIQTQKVTPALPQTQEEFGHAVAMSGSHLAVGAPKSSRDALGGGSAWIFESNGFSFVETARLVSPQVTAGGAFGSAVAVWSSAGVSRAVVGAARESVNGTSAGQAHVFVQSVGGAWVFQATLQPDGVPTTNDEFGRTVSASVNRIAVGIPGDDSVAANGGSVMIFLWSGQGWIPEQRIFSPAPDALGEFGGALALDGDTLAVGAYREDGGAVDAGRVHIFSRGASGWQFSQTILSPSPQVLGEFGSSVAIDGDSIAVGADRDNGTALGSGAGYLFRRSQSSAWGCVAVLCSSNSQVSEFNGVAIGISGLRVIMGAPLRSQSGAYQGAAFIEDLSADCDLDLIPDAVEILAGAGDCNLNAIPDSCDIAQGTPDANGNGVPDSCEVVPCPGDISGNGFVTGVDLALLLSAWGTSGTKVPGSDINEDGEVNGADLAAILSGWGPCP